MHFYGIAYNWRRLANAGKLRAKPHPKALAT